MINQSNTSIMEKEFLDNESKTSIQEEKINSIFKLPFNIEEFTKLNEEEQIEYMTKRENWVQSIYQNNY